MTCYDTRPVSLPVRVRAEYPGTSRTEQGSTVTTAVTCNRGCHGQGISAVSKPVSPARVLLLA
eukprot:1954488-Rhodomonas_salina.3